MKINNFKTFDELDVYFKDTLVDLWVSHKRLLREVGLHLRKKIRNAYGRYWPWWLKSNSSPVTPLLRTWKLRGSVSMRVTGNTVEVFSKLEWLALIHEYGAVYKMTDKQRRFLFSQVFKEKTKIKGRPRSNWWSGMTTIPARPIWRRIISIEEKNVEKIAEDIFDNIFK